MKKSKKCTKCCNIKELDLFHKDKTQTDGHFFWCKQCKNEQGKLYYGTNPQKYKDLASKYRMLNKDKVTELHKKEYVRNKDRCKVLNALNYIKNKERIKICQSSWRVNNIEKCREFGRKWARENPAKACANVRKRQAAKLKRTPLWLTKEQLKEIQNFYILAQELRWLSEEPLHVDHIIPLQGKNVSGLHVPWNLQILPRSTNCKKHNNL